MDITITQENKTATAYIYIYGLSPSFPQVGQSSTNNTKSRSFIVPIIIILPFCLPASRQEIKKMENVLLN